MQKKTRTSTGSGNGSSPAVKRAAPVSREAEQRYRRLFNQMADPVFVIDAASLRFVDCNEAACRDYGYSREQFLRMTPIDLHPPHERELAERRLREKQWSLREYHHIASDGRQRTVEVSTTNIQYHGRAAHLSIVHDITERSLAQQKLALHVQQTPLAVIEWNTDFEVTAWNPAAERIFGFSAAEAMGKKATFIIPSEAHHHVAEIWSQLLARRGGRRSTNQNCTRDGRTIMCEWYNTPLVDSLGRVIGVASLCEDVTERYRAEQSLQVQKAYLEQLFESAPEGIAIVNNSDEVVRVNQEFTRMFGYASEEIAGAPLALIVPPDRSNESRFLKNTVEKGMTLNVETTRRRKDGSLVDVSILGTPINVSGGNIAVYLIFRDITENKRAERALTESESKFRAVAETAAFAIFIHDGNRLVYVNKATEQISGYSREELLSMDPSALLTPSYQETLRERLRARQRGIEVPAQHEFSIIRRDGATRWIEANANQIQFEGRSAALVTALDITERKRSEQLHSALYRIADVTSSAEDLQELYAAIHRIVGELMYARNFYIAIYDEQANLLSFPYFVDSEDPTPTPKPLGKGLTEYVLRSGEPQLISPEGFASLIALREVESIGAPSVDWLGVPMKKGEKAFGVLVVQSYTPSIRYGEAEKEILTFVSQHVASALERKQQQEALRESEARYRSLVQSAVFGMYRSNIEDRFLDVNPALVSMLGYESAAQVVRLNLARDIFVDPSDYRKLIRAYGSDERVAGVEVPWKRKDGTRFTVRLSGRPLLDSSGEPVGFEMIAEDITERRALELQLQQSQRMEAIGRLAGGVAHDFNNLLTVIKGYSELMLDELKPSDPMRGEMEEVQRAADRAASLTRQLLAFSRRQVLAPKVLDLNDLVRDTEKLLRRLLGEDVELITALDQQLGSVRADPGQIEQVLMNLAVNARDAMPSGGKLTIETCNKDLDRLYTREHAVVKPGRYVLLAVSDNGTGMDGEIASHVFEPFFTTKEQGKGTGLGLSTVYGIVKQSGGYIWVYSEPGLGTTFKIYLPQVDAAAERLPAQQLRPEVYRGTETILLVEDEEGVRSLIRQVLTRHGYTVLESGHGGEALLLCERHPGRIDLLLTDVVLSQMSGRELAERLTPLRHDMKVLYMSGYTDEAIVHHGVLTPGSAFVQKPFTTEALTRKVRQVLDSKPQ
jgi:two-component system cell cycle sensor histidine kinase/response regulator CckA